LCCAETGSPLWSAAGHQRNDTLSASSLAPLPLDQSTVVTVLPRDAAVTGNTPCLRLDAAAVDGSFTNVAGNVASLYQTQQQQQQQQIDFRSVTTCFRLATKSCGPDFYRLRRLLRRAKRQAAGTAADVTDKDDGDDGSVSRYPLYCIVCRVHLNAQLQAKQHYKGRSHARRVRLLYGAPALTAGTASDPAFSIVSNDAEVSSVY